MDGFNGTNKTMAPLAETGSGDAALKKRCQQILGAVLWLVTRTRPDIAYAHSKAASMIDKDLQECYTRAVNMLAYIQSCPNFGLKYPRATTAPSLSVYGDCFFAPTGSASHEGNCAYVGSSFVGWRSKRQTMTAMSSCEGEIIAAQGPLSLAGLSDSF